MKNLKELRKLGIAHSVLVSDIKTRFDSNSVGKDYYILIPSKCQSELTDNLHFFKVEDDERVLGKEASKEDITELMIDKDNYKVVKKEDFGKVYEWNKKSLKQEIEQL